MNWPAVFGDAFWILALAVIANTALQARRRLAPTDRLGLPWGLGRLGLGQPRDAALITALALPFAVGAGLSWMARAPSLEASGLLIGLTRVFAAGAVAGLHVTWLKATLDRHAS